MTTAAGAERLGGNSIGLAPWQTMKLSSSMKVTGTPARHGPAHLDRGPVTGFVLEIEDDPSATTYVSGDTVWYECVLGAPRVDAVGPVHLTMTAQEGVTTARAFPHATIVPLHFEGWAHFSESRPVIEGASAGR